MQRNLLALYESIANETNCPVTLPIKMFLPCNHDEQMLHSTIKDAITNYSCGAFVDEKLNFEDGEI